MPATLAPSERRQQSHRTAAIGQGHGDRGFIVKMPVATVESCIFFFNIFISIWNMIEIGLCVESSCLVEPLIGLGALIEMCFGLLVVGSRQQNGCGWKTT